MIGRTNAGAGKTIFPTGIEITSAPTKTTYNAGENIDLTGIVVTATFSDGSAKEVTSECTFSPASGTVIYEDAVKITANWTWEDTNTELSNKVDKVSGKGLSTNDYTNDEKTKLSSLNAALIVQNSVSVATSAWASDTTYEDYPFRVSIPIDGCTVNHIPEVTFALADAISGNFAPIAETYDGGVYIYAAEVPSEAMTIPTIKLTKVVS